MTTNKNKFQAYSASFPRLTKNEARKKRREIVNSNGHGRKSSLHRIIVAGKQEALETTRNNEIFTSPNSGIRWWVFLQSFLHSHGRKKSHLPRKFIIQKFHCRPLGERGPNDISIATIFYINITIL